jgi:hypothetical protein
MNGHIRDAACRGGALVTPAKIERAAHAQAAHDVDIGRGKMTEVIGAEDPAPAHDAAIGRRITAEIAEIAGAFEIKVAGRKIRHRRQLKLICTAEK